MLITRSGSSAPSVDSQRWRALKDGVMDIGQMEHANRPRTGGQHRLHPPDESERIDLIQARVGQAAGADRPCAE